MRRIVLIAATALGLTVSPVAADAAGIGDEDSNCESCEALLDLAVAHPGRRHDRTRDLYRRPAETLGFFRIRPTMKVGEYAPGSGWYSRVLGVYLGAQGHLAGLHPNVAIPLADEALRQGTCDAAARYADAVAGWTGQPAARFAGYTLDAAPEGERSSFDRILIMRRLHNLQRSNMLYSELTAMRGLLKDDGMLGIEQHRARPDAPAAYADGSKGYMREKDVVALVEAHGFDLVDRSEVNANPRDTADHAQGVWSLPPSLRAGDAETDADAARRAAIGESDRMTLLFRKRA